MLSNIFTHFYKRHNMKNKIIIFVSIIITISVAGVFIFLQSESIEYQSASEAEEDEQISQLLKKVEEDKIAGEKMGFDMHKKREWLTSGPFQIDRSVYHLGEKIFINVEKLPPGLNGKMVFAKIYNSTHSQIYKSLMFDSEKEQQNSYFAVFPSLSRQFCTIDDIVGDWEVTFEGTNLKTLEFKIINSFVPGNEEYFDPVC